MPWAHNKILLKTIDTTINFLYKVAHTTNSMLFNGSPAETEARRREEVRKGRKGRLFMRLDMGWEAARNNRLAGTGQSTGACLILSAVTRQ